MILPLNFLPRHFTIIDLRRCYSQRWTLASRSLSSVKMKTISIISVKISVCWIRKYRILYSQSVILIHAMTKTFTRILNFLKLSFLLFSHLISFPFLFCSLLFSSVLSPPFNLPTSRMRSNKRARMWSSKRGESRVRWVQKARSKRLRGRGRVEILLVVW